MLSLESWPLADRRRITGVFADIDDTLTTHGAITPDALDALGALKAAGLHVIPITGRPAALRSARASSASGVMAPSVVRVSSMSVKTPVMRRRSANGQEDSGFTAMP